MTLHQATELHSASSEAYQCSFSRQPKDYIPSSTGTEHAVSAAGLVFVIKGHTAIFSLQLLALCIADFMWLLCKNANLAQNIHLVSSIQWLPTVSICQQLVQSEMRAELPQFPPLLEDLWQLWQKLTLNSFCCMQCHLLTCSNFQSAY